jgi:hypothetical protein
VIPGGVWAAGNVSLALRDVDLHRLEDRSQIGLAGDGLGRATRFVERGQQNRDEQRNDADHDEQFDEGKTKPATTTATAAAEWFANDACCRMHTFTSSRMTRASTLRVATLL